MYIKAGRVAGLNEITALIGGKGVLNFRVTMSLFGRTAVVSSRRVIGAKGGVRGEGTAETEVTTERRK